MIVHILLLIYISLCGGAVYLRGVSPRKNKVFLFLAFAGVLFVQSMRSYQVGLDTFDYYRAFFSARSESVGGFIGSWEPLYLWLNRFVGFFTSNPQWLLFAGSAILDIGVMVFIYYNTEEGKAAFWPVLYWIVFLNYLNSMNLFRQYIAMAFACNTYTILVRDRSKKAYFFAAVLMLIGMGFHMVSITALLIAVPFIMKWDNKKSLVYGALVAVAIFMLSSRGLQLALRLIPKLTRYLDTKYLQGGEVGGFYIGVSMLRLLCLSIVLLMPRFTDDSREHLFPLSFYMIISIGLYLLKTRYFIMNRFTYFFDIFQIIYYARIIDRFRENKVIKVFAYLVCWGIFLYTLRTYEGSRGCVPYTFFWQVTQITTIQ